MKALILFTLLCTLIACQKNDIEPVKYNTPVWVHYVLKSNEIPKHMTCRLWSADQYGNRKKLVAELDTTVTGSVDIVLMQNDAPYIYCVTSCTVTCEEGDTMSLSVGSRETVYVKRSGSCVSDKIEFSNEFLKLYE